MGGTNRAVRDHDRTKGNLQATPQIYTKMAGYRAEVAKSTHALRVNQVGTNCLRIFFFAIFFFRGADFFSAEARHFCAENRGNTESFDA